MMKNLIDYRNETITKLIMQVLIFWQSDSDDNQKNKKTTSMSTSTTDRNTTTIDKTICRNILLEMGDISIEGVTKMKVDVNGENNTDKDLALGMNDNVDSNKDMTVRNGWLQSFFYHTCSNDNKNRFILITSTGNQPIQKEVSTSIRTVKVLFCFLHILVAVVPIHSLIFCQLAFFEEKKCAFWVISKILFFIYLLT